MEEVKEDITNDETVDTNVDVDETTENEEPSVETITFQKNKALKQRDEARKELDELKAAKADNSKEDKPTPTVDKSGLESKLEAIEFTVANKELDADNVAEIVSYAKGKGITLEEAKKSPVIEAYLKADAEQKSLDKASPDGSRSPKTKQKPQPTTFKEHEKWAREQMGI